MGDVFSQTVVFYCNDFSMGGTETLLLRLMKYYRSLGYRVILLTVTPIHESILNDAKNIDFEHYIHKTTEFYSLGKKLSFNSQEKPIVITQFMPEFLRCFRILRKKNYGVEFKHLLYIVHPDSTLYRPKFLTYFARIMILRLLYRNALVFMDETCVKNCREFYNLKETVKFDIFRLPMFINNNCDTYSFKNEIFNILTISRFEFPFKGYVLGLIHSFEKLSKKYPFLTLTIIGHGEGKSEVDALIANLPLTISSKITLLEKIPYHKINNYIMKCDTFVGMGTTVLDAANSNKIVIMAIAYQMQNFSAGFFHENYYSIGEVYKSRISYPVFEDLIESVVNLGESEFIDSAKRSKNVLKKYYNIEDIANGLLEHTNGYFSRLERVLIGLLANTYIYRVGIANYIKAKWM